MPRPWRSGTIATSGGWRLAEDIEQVGHGRGRHGRKVGGQHEQGRGAVLERGGPCLRETVVEATICLADHACPGGARERRHFVVRGDDDRLGDPRRPESRGEGALEEADHQVPALLGVEHLAEPRLRALQVPDRHDRDDAFRHAAPANSSTSAASRARAASSVMTVSVTRVRMPSASIAVASSRSSVSSTKRSATRA